MAAEEHDLRPDVIVHTHAGDLHPKAVGDLDQLVVGTIRTLPIDAVEAAGSGHPGTPMALAPLAYVLWSRFLTHDPPDPRWPDRDRFVLSAGHAPMLLYAMLHLSGYDLPLDELKRFGQWGSLCPGHPERGVTPGVEVTTGPLGQGFANAVGLAIAERMLAARFNRPGHEVVDHHTYAICSDGDLMEGVSAEAASLAGNLDLGKLIAFYDDNHITIEGSTELAFCEQVGKRFDAYGWHVLSVDDANDLDEVADAIEAARAERDHPSLVIVRSVNGYGAPTKQGTAASHGSPLGAEEARGRSRTSGGPTRNPLRCPSTPMRSGEPRSRLDGRDTPIGRNGSRATRGSSRSSPRSSFARWPEISRPAGDGRCPRSRRESRWRRAPPPARCSTRSFPWCRSWSAARQTWHRRPTPTSKGPRTSPAASSHPRAVRRPRGEEEMSLEAPQPQAIVIFGASGDLSRRKVLPALYNLARERLLPERCAVIGYARTEWTEDEFRDRARRAIEEFSRTPIEEEVWKRFSDALCYLAGPFDDENCFGPLHDRLGQLDEVWGTEGRRLYYCATPPSAFPLIVSRLGECGPQEGARIVIEKPFGRDLASARELNAAVHRVFAESQVFRIDHYLGKETVQNILLFRFANSMFERVWNRDAIDHVQITVAESIGVEGRGAFYEEAGALRDIVQNHMLQVLSFLAMEPPRSFEAEAIRDEKVKVLRAVRALDPYEVVRGQYAAGTIEGLPVPGYREEEGVAAGSTVETFIALRARIENWRWAGVPFFLRTGKHLPHRTTEVTIAFREAPSYLFEGLGLPAPPPDHLSLRIQPDEGISFAFQAKEPGPRFAPTTVRMDFAYESSFEAVPADAYERLLHDVASGDHTLFPREDGVERAWEIVAPVLDAPPRVEPYEAGSWGPAASAELIAPRRWHLR